MKISLNWLREFINNSLPLKELADKLTMSGIEVKSIESTGRAWDKILVGQIIAIEPHPNADRLKLATIDFGKGQPTVVCGAPNIQVGNKVPFAQIGAQLIDGHTGELFQLKPAMIRGTASEGMACSEKELGISDNHEGILILPPEAPLGIPLADYLGDAILDLEITPNRPDCLSVIGIAREVAAFIKQEIKLPPTDYTEEGPAIGQLVSVEIIDADLCRRYCASLIEDVRVAPSPPWMQQRLIACGMRPINNIVDITNYVMLEYGQPLHAFDFRQIGEKKIVVRRASQGEKLTSLDGVDRVLNPDTLVIADCQIPVAIAGVMGGADSEVIDITKSVLLESANFHPISIRRTSVNLKLRSEASIRFERGISPELTLPALKRATQLIVELAGGKAARGIIDVYPGKKEREPIVFHTSWVKRLLGIELKREQIIEILISLGFQCQSLDSLEQMQIAVPYWRMDVNRAADIVEELARIIGYDSIPTTTLSSQLPRQQPTPTLTFREDLRDMLVGCGFQEAITYSLTSHDRLARITSVGQPVKVANPLSIEQEYLRTSLRPGLLGILAENQKHEDGSLRFFEIGKVFFARGSDLPEEREILAGVLSGPRSEPSWLGEKGQLDFFDAKGVVETILRRLGAEADFEASTEASLHPGRIAKILIDHTAVGIVGEVHPGVAGSFDLLPQPVAIFELDIDRLLSCNKLRGKYSPLSRFPRSVRDLAIVVDVAVPARKVEEIIRGRGLPLVSHITLFDLYTGKQVPPGKKSLAFRIDYQSSTHTLTDEEMEAVEKDILSKLTREVGATLRA